jgi:CheY-like chemotaxis protein
VSKTLLAVDDSATMRKVMEITFSGEDFNVLTSADKDGALSKLTENPSVVLVDAALDSDGYALAKEIRKRLPGAVLLLLASRYAPYDQAKGKDAGADDFMDKPFDTQQIIDKVKKLLSTKADAPVAAVAAAAPPPPPTPPTPAANAMPRLSANASPPAPPVAAAPPAKFTPGPQQSRSATLMFPLGVPPEAGAPPPPAAPPVAAPPPAAPKPAPVVEAKAPVAAPPVQPRPAPVAPPVVHAPPVAHAPAAITSAVNGQLAGKLGDLGLSPAQADAVLALSREVVERVVWEVVPQLAETIIKEEIARLTKEG